MSYDTNVYIGAYIECYNPRVKTDITELECCGKTHKQGTNFCSECGKKLIPVKTHESMEKSVDVSKVSDDINEELLPTNFYDHEFEGHEIKDVWITAYGEDEIELDEIKDIGSIDIPKEIEEFKLKFSEEISIIGRAYGEENIKIKYGLMVYYS